MLEVAMEVSETKVKFTICTILVEWLILRDKQG